MHGFRDNEIVLPTGNDVIVITRFYCQPDMTSP